MCLDVEAIASLEWHAHTDAFDFLCVFSQLNNGSLYRKNINIAPYLHVSYFSVVCLVIFLFLLLWYFYFFRSCCCCCCLFLCCIHFPFHLNSVLFVSVWMVLFVAVVIRFALCDICERFVALWLWYWFASFDNHSNPIRLSIQNSVTDNHIHTRIDFYFVHFCFSFICLLFYFVVVFLLLAFFGSFILNSPVFCMH